MQEKAPLQGGRVDERYLVDGHPTILRDVRSLDHALRVHDERLTMLEFNVLTSFMRGHGYTLAPRYGSTMARIAAMYPHAIVRREDPERLISALASGAPLTVRFDATAHGGIPYPNAGVLSADARGLRIPYQRGFGRMHGDGGEAGCMVAVVGFVPERADVQVRQLSGDSYPHYNIPDERSRIRMVDGVVPADAIVFVSFLVPRSFCPEGLLEGEVGEQTTHYVTFLFPHDGFVGDKQVH